MSLQGGVAILSLLPSAVSSSFGEWDYEDSKSSFHGAKLKHRETCFARYGAFPGKRLAALQFEMFGASDRIVSSASFRVCRAQVHASGCMLKILELAL